VRNEDVEHMRYAAPEVRIVCSRMLTYAHVYAEHMLPRR
jgi:hypothetical protein